MNTLTTVLCITFLWYFGESHENDTTLQLVHVFFRHGSRTPTPDELYLNDPYTPDQFEPPGLAQLTNRGKRRAFKLGQLLRSRYDSFLGSTYNSEVLFARSTDTDRTKMTVLLVLAGLYPPSLSEKWSDSVEWQPIPYNYDTPKYDFTLRRPAEFCPAYVRELQLVLNSQEVQDLLRSNKQIFQYVEKNSGNTMNKLKDMFRLYQTLNSEENMNLILPKWTNSVYPLIIHDMAGQQCRFENFNIKLKRLNGGRSLQGVVDSMKAKSLQSLHPAGRKLYLYSGHENNVINILSALNLFEPHVPKFASSVMIELHYFNDTQKYAVKVFYLKRLSSQPLEQVVPGCDSPCPLHDFIRLTEPMIPVNYTAECESDKALD